MKLERKTPRRAPKTPASVTPAPATKAPAPKAAALKAPAPKASPAPMPGEAKPRRTPKTTKLKPAPAPAPAPVVEAVPAKPRRVAKTATEAQPPAAPKPALATKSKRPARPAAATAMKAKRPASPRKLRQAKLEIPPILLGGDIAAPTGVSGPGQRYALGPVTPPAHASPAAELGELPESYGTARLWLAARDPQWLYAHWDLTSEQQRKYNTESDDGHLIVRVFEKEILGEPFVTQHVHPESRNWFVHVGRGGTKFVAQLGYLDHRERWQTIAVSAATVTPPDALSDDLSADFATLPVDVPFERLVELVTSVTSRNVPLMEALTQLRETSNPNLPTADTFAPAPVVESAPQPASSAPAASPAPVAAAGPAPASEWTPAQAKALAEVVTMDEVRRVWIGSLEITELVRRQLVKQLSEEAAAQLAAGQGSLGLGSPSSPFGALGSLPGPFGAGAGARGFWFNINAELIIYGATEPDATVTIGGRKIRLRPDGTFSYRFALPDGNFDLPAIATSAAGDDARAAALSFRRQTAYHGDVGTHPQDARLQPPTADAVA